MKKLLISLLVMTLIACTPTTPESELNNVMREMLSQLEQNETKGFLTKFVILDNRHKGVTDLPEDKVESIKFYLRRALELSPAFNENHTVATYALTMHDEPDYPMPWVFHKISGNWKVKN